MQMLAGEADKINENDPRQAANLLRKLSEMTGMQMGPGMNEALKRMESGEDPDQIESEMGDILQSEEPFMMPGAAGQAGKAKKPAPQRDETLVRTLVPAKYPPYSRIYLRTLRVAALFAPCGQISMQQRHWMQASVFICIAPAGCVMHCRGQARRHISHSTHFSFIIAGCVVRYALRKRMRGRGIFAIMS